MASSDVDFQLFDADNHYYEATDAFTRHLDPKLAKRTMQWAEINGKQRLLVGGRLNRFIPNPTFDPVARPGALDDYFRGQKAGDDIRAAFGDLEPISPAYREPAARVALMDEQGIEGCFLFPTLGVGMEQPLVTDPEAAHAVFHAFNQWLLDDWTFDYQDRIFAAPYFTLLDPDAAVRELDWALAQGAKVIVMRAGPIQAPTGFRSPGDPVYDPFWARVNEAGILVAYHSGESGYDRYAAEWGESSEMEAFRHNPFKVITSGGPPDLRHDGRAGVPRRVRAAPERPGRDDRERQRVGAAAREEDEEVVRAGAERVPGWRPGRGSARRTSGSRRTTRTISSGCAGRSAPSASCSGRTTRTPRDWPTPRAS